MDFAWKVMYDLQSHIQGFTREPFCMNLELASNALRDFHARWELMRNDLHQARVMLDPYLHGFLPLHKDPQARVKLNRVLRKLAPDNHSYMEVLRQYQQFLQNEGSFADSTDPVDLQLLPHEW